MCSDRREHGCSAGSCPQRGPETDLLREGEKEGTREKEREKDRNRERARIVSWYTGVRQQ